MNLPGFTAEVGLGQRVTLLAPAARTDHLPTCERIIPQLRRQTAAEILLGTAAFGRMDPHDPASLKQEPCSGYSEYGKRLQALADGEKTALVDVTRHWAEYVRKSGEGVNYYKRDVVHANELGEQILGRIMAAFLVAEDD